MLLSNVTEDLVNDLEIDDESLSILKQIVKGLKTVYNHYKSDLGSSPTKKGIQAKQMTKPILNFLRELDICPYVLNQKTCFLVWYFTGLVPFESISVKIRAQLFSICQSVPDDALF